MSTQYSFIELHHDYFKYCASYDSEIPKDKEDLGMGWVSIYNEFELCFKRHYLVSIEKWWVDLKDYWIIEIEINGYPNTLKLHIISKEEMQKTYNTLFDYIILNKPCQ